MKEPRKNQNQIVVAQLCCFLFAAIFGLSGHLFSEASRPILYKMVDAIFITGTILLAMKLASDGWDMPAAGFTLLSIAWGVFFLAKDFHEQEVGEDIFTSAFYFLLPSMILVTFYPRFPLLIKIVSLLTIVPSLIGLIASKTGVPLEEYDIWRTINYQSVHITSLFWGFFFFMEFRKSRLNVSTIIDSEIGDEPNKGDSENS